MNDTTYGQEVQAAIHEAMRDAAYYSESYDLDTRAAAYCTGKSDARRRRARRWCAEGACCRSWIGRAYTRGYDEVLAQRSAT